MTDYERHLEFFSKLRPIVSDNDWMDASKLSTELSKKSVDFRENKEARFCLLVKKLLDKAS